VPQKTKDAGREPGATNAEKKADPSPPFANVATGFGMTVGWWRASLRKFRVADGVEDQRKNRTTDEARVGSRLRCESEITARGKSKEKKLTL
jgi:hypothetical protein